MLVVSVVTVNAGSGNAGSGMVGMEKGWCAHCMQAARNSCIDTVPVSMILLVLECPYFSSLRAFMVNTYFSLFAIVVHLLTGRVRPCF